MRTLNHNSDSLFPQFKAIQSHLAKPDVYHIFIHNITITNE